MASKLQNSQLTNWATYQMYLRQCLSLAENVFKYENLPSFIDVPYMNKTLLRKGQIAFFYDEIFDSVLCLPFVKYGSLDVYGRYKSIQVIGSNSYTRVLKPDEFIIMYDNNGQYPIYIDILQYAERLALMTRTIDINISQQKTPRIWQTSTDTERTIKDLLNNIDGLTESVTTYKNLAIDEINAILAPAPFVSDKVNEQKREVWNEFFRLIGITSLTVQKKERNIRDEITSSLGGTIASRFQRFEPRKKAIDLVNEKFKDKLNGKEIIVSYYDDLPTNLKQDEVFEDETIESEVVKNGNL